jgi:beta-barrel assembly-enhancing protease
MTEFDEKPHAKWIGLIWIALIVVVAFVSVRGFPIALKQIPLTWESHLANVFGTPIEARQECEENPQAKALLERIVIRLYPQNETEQKFELRVRAVDMPDINAFAFLGGRIWILKGLFHFAKSPEEVAGVLAHEIEHITHRHLLEGAAGSLLLRYAFRLITNVDAGPLFQKFLNLKFTSHQEEEADSGALDRLQKAKIDPKGFKDFFERLTNEQGSGFTLLSDHPSNESRAQRVSERAAYPSEPMMTSSEWGTLKDICGKPKDKTR